LEVAQHLDCGVIEAAVARKGVAGSGNDQYHIDDLQYQHHEAGKEDGTEDQGTPEVLIGVDQGDVGIVLILQNHQGNLQGTGRQQGW